MTKIIPLIFILVLGLTDLTYAAQPIDNLKSPINEILRVLNDSQYQGKDKKKSQLKKLNSILSGLFDFVEISRRALAKNWKVFTPQERKEFSIAFEELLGDIYLRKIQKKFKNDSVAFVGQDMVSEKKAFVKTKIVRETMEIPVDYSMKLKKGAWKVYDIKVEGVSLVKNYRTQFNKILIKKSPAFLIDMVKKKVERNKKS